MPLEYSKPSRRPSPGITVEHVDEGLWKDMMVMVMVMMMKKLSKQKPLSLKILVTLV